MLHVLRVIVIIMFISGYNALRYRGGGKIILTALKSTTVSAAEASSLDYVASSKASIESLFADSEDLLADDCHHIMLVPKSQYEAFKVDVVDKMSNATLEVLKGASVDLTKFPGPKVIALGDDRQQTYALYDDKCATSKVSFSSLFSQVVKLPKEKKMIRFSSFKNAELEAPVANRLSFAWTTHNYKLNAFKKQREGGGGCGSKSNNKRIVWPANADRRGVVALARATLVFRHLVDSPALTLGPKELGEVAEAIAKEYGATDIKVHTGVETLCRQGASCFPQVAAVGMAASDGREPRVVEWRWGNEGDREVVIIGKGITFDTGGLNIKGPSMKGMKKDMAGSAQALCLAGWIMETGLKCNLRVIIPIAENSVGGIALRPSDIIRSRSGKTSEITNTDAEGRLILADALVAACENPIDASEGINRRRIIVDFATLTGAARVALGGELPALFSNDHAAMMDLFGLSHSHEEGVMDEFEGIDPVWPLPLWEPMRQDLKSPIADIVNAPGTSGGAITAALYLSEFVTPLTAESSRASAYLRGGNGANKDNGKGKEEEEDDDDDDEEVVVVDGEEGSSTNGDKLAPIWFHVDFPGGKPAAMRAVYSYLKKCL